MRLKRRALIGRHVPEYNREFLLGLFRYHRSFSSVRIVFDNVW
jgi:hypothetical protein